MDWLIIAIISTVFFSAASILDKLLLGGYAEDSRAYMVLQILASQLFTIPVIIIQGPDFVYPESCYALIAGAMQIVPAIFYLRAMQVEEVTRVNALEYVYPVFVFIGSIFLLGETLGLRNCAGGLLLLAGSILISYNRNGPQGSGGLAALSPAIKPFMSYWVFTAIHFLSLKYLLGSFDEWTLYTWMSLGSLIAILPLMGIASTRQAVKGFFKKGKFAMGALISEEALQFLGLIFSIFAYSMGSVALVSSVGALQPILTLLLILGMGIFAPKLARQMNECTDRDALIQKSMSFIVVLAGIYFLC